MSCNTVGIDIASAERLEALLWR